MTKNEQQLIHTMVLELVSSMQHPAYGWNVPYLDTDFSMMLGEDLEAIRLKYTKLPMTGIEV